MFNNANVIYRTKFVDGVSQVTRTMGIGSSRGRTLGASNGEDSSIAGKAGKKTGRKGKENAVA
jgi:structural maintenance of chromosome 2